MKVLLVDDHRLMLEGLANLLTAHGVQVVGMAKDGLEAGALVGTLQPDLILMDIRMPRCDGLEATRRIKANFPHIGIVILTTSTENKDLFEAVKSGACGYLLKSMDTDDLIESLEQAEQGIPPFSPGLAVKVLEEFARMAAGAQAEGGIENTQEEETPVLTERQTEVLRLMAQGLSYKEAGIRLSLSPRTIKYHMAEIMKLLHLANRAQVVAYAVRNNL